jgi:hypothetical protein
VARLPQEGDTQFSVSPAAVRDVFLDEHGHRDVGTDSLIDRGGLTRWVRVGHLSGGRSIVADGRTTTPPTRSSLGDGRSSVPNSRDHHPAGPVVYRVPLLALADIATSAGASSIGATSGNCRDGEGLREHGPGGPLTGLALGHWELTGSACSPPSYTPVTERSRQHGQPTAFVLAWLKSRRRGASLSCLPNVVRGYRRRAALRRNPHATVRHDEAPGMQRGSASRICVAC